MRTVVLAAVIVVTLPRRAAVTAVAMIVEALAAEALAAEAPAVEAPLAKALQAVKKV
jgi:hypothetical protein